MACKDGGESRQDVVQNDKISLVDIAPEGEGGGVGCTGIKRGCTCITTLSYCKCNVGYRKASGYEMKQNCRLGDRCSRDRCARFFPM